MKEKIFFLYTKYAIISFFILIKYINNTLYFSYPTAITLNNGNIFIIHKTGITVCDSTFSRIIKYVKNFTTDYEQISTEQKLSKVSLEKFSDGYIISIIMFKVYIFDKLGNLKAYKDISYAYDNLYYSLTPYKYDIDFYYFLVGFFNQQKLYLFYYKYDPSLQQIIEVAKNLGFYEFDEFDNAIYLENKGISCQFLKYSNQQDLILCLFSVYYHFQNELDYVSFYIRGNSIEPQTIEYKNYDYSIECIKSFSLSDHSKALFCYYLFNSDVYCKIFRYIYRK